ncbi:MAG TPA: YafY family protein [Steroidobacteraceae bacterium]|jgi:predicted DNA-binding transcriptional regulator YafY
MRAERLISLLMALQRRNAATAGELAMRLNVSVRTIFRDIDALSGMGVPVYSEPGRGGGIRLLEGYSSDLTGLSSGEAEALALIASPATTGVSQLTAPTRTALDKLAAAVPSMHQIRAQHARSRLLFDTKPWFRSLDASPHLDELRACIWSDERIEIGYERSDGTRKTYRVDPHALVVKVDTWYLIGHVTQPGNAEAEVRVFRLSRLQSLRRLGETFVRNASFDLHRFWHDWCERFEKNVPSNYSVDIIISARGRRQLLDTYGRWFRKQLEPLGEKFRRRPVTLELEREETALRVLFGLGDDVEIVKPRVLRKKLNALALRVVAATR